VSISYGYDVGVSSDHLVSSYTNMAMHQFPDSVVQSIVKMEPEMDYNECAYAASIAIAQSKAQIQPPTLAVMLQDQAQSFMYQLPSLPPQAQHYPEVIQSIYS